MRLHLRRAKNARLYAQASHAARESVERKLATINANVKARKRDLREAIRLAARLARHV